MMKVRTAAALVSTLLCQACGFHPLYAPGGGQSGSLAAVYVDIIPNRPGQLLRQALQSRLEGSSSGTAKQYTLAVAYSNAVQGLSVQADNSTTRNRDVGTAIWSLHPAGNASTQIAGGTVRSLDGYNIIDEQFFYSDLEEEAAERRQANALADQIVMGLAVYFGKHTKHG